MLGLIKSSQERKYLLKEFKKQILTNKKLSLTAMLYVRMIQLECYFNSKAKGLHSLFTKIIFLVDKPFQLICKI
jgi:hypothetical protein